MIFVGNMNLPINLEVISSFIILSYFIQRLSVSIYVSRILFMFLITNLWFPLQISYIFFIPFVAFILRNPVTFVVLKNEIFNFYLVSNYFIGMLLILIMALYLAIMLSIFNISNIFSILSYRCNVVYVISRNVYFFLILYISCCFSLPAFINWDLLYNVE